RSDKDELERVGAALAGIPSPRARDEERTKHGRGGQHGPPWPDAAPCRRCGGDLSHDARVESRINRHGTTELLYDACDDVVFWFKHARPLSGTSAAARARASRAS